MQTNQTNTPEETQQHGIKRDADYAVPEPQSKMLEPTILQRWEAMIKGSVDGTVVFVTGSSAKGLVPVYGDPNNLLSQNDNQ